MEAALLALTVGTTVASGVSQVRTGLAQADLAKARGKAAKEDIERETEALLGTQRARFGKAGVATDTGTPLDVIVASAAEQKLRSLRERFLFETEGEVATSQAIGGALGSVAQLGGTLLGGIQRSPSPKAGGNP